MWRGVRWYLVGFFVLIALAGCGRSFLHYAQREPWRREAETACMRAGVIKEGRGLVRVEPIEGPGVCGAVYPLKVAAIGASSAFGFADEPLRPPGSIPTGPQAPRWPIASPRTSPPSAVQSNALPPPAAAPSNPVPAMGDPRYATPVPAPAPVGPPMSISPPGIDPQASVRDPQYPYPQRPAFGLSPPASVRPQPATPPVEEIDDYDEPVRTRPGVAPPRAAPAPLPALGPQRSPRATGATAVEIKPAATLACPIVSALDQWIANAVQPAAQHWFGQPVVEIRQISAYSCRGMNGNPNSRISEHAFGNALDIAAFVLADGHRITVKDGWRGTPEEQGFLRDVQGAACEQFTTVLAPGSNRFHYDHIHVDLMRRTSGRRICNPGAIDGELVAARARKDRLMAARQAPPPTRRYDPPFDSRNDPFAWRGDAVRRGDPATTGSVGPKSGKPTDEDDDWIEDDAPRPQIDWHGAFR
jgi:hypothetical protein